MHMFILLLLATTGGLALSGIAANLYRILARKPRGRFEKLFYCAVMIFAGPSVLIENATGSFRKKACSGAAYLFAIGLSTYWSLALGLALIAVVNV
jgi:hypothetical protein